MPKEAQRGQRRLGECNIASMWPHKAQRGWKRQLLLKQKRKVHKVEREELEGKDRRTYNLLPLLEFSNLAFPPLTYQPLSRVIDVPLACQPFSDALAATLSFLVLCRSSLILVT